MTPSIDLNADLGEGGTQDARLIRLARSVNIACGGHAGDDATMERAIRLAMADGAAVGAHPGYEDPAHFGRRPLQLSPDAVQAMVVRQLRHFAGIARTAGAHVHHVKPHGALYTQASTDAGLATAVAAAVAEVFPGCGFLVPPGGALALAGDAAGLRVIPEGFADRRYQADGTLVPRGSTDAAIDDPAAAARQALAIALHGRVATVGNTTIPLPARSLCVHGDGPHAVALLAAVRRALEAAGLRIESA